MWGSIGNAKGVAVGGVGRARCSQRGQRREEANVIEALAVSISAELGSGLGQLQREVKESAHYIH